jgi:hypothetical protein
MAVLMRRKLAFIFLVLASMASGLALAQSGTLMKSATWWDPEESGWGLFTIDQGNVIAPGWFTYDETGKPTWFLVPGAVPQSDGSFAGPVCRFSGVPLAQINGNAADPCQPIGSARLNFVGNTRLDFEYTIGSITQTKSLTRFPFAGRDIVCEPSPTPSRAAAANFSDLWWAAPESEGWGVHMSHVDDSLFATWYTYDTDRRAVFYVGVTSRQPNGSFSGPILLQNNGTPFLQIDGSPASSGAQPVGTMTVDFSDGETATFSYSFTGGISQTKPLSRFQFGSAASVCRTVSFGTIVDDEAVRQAYQSSFGLSVPRPAIVFSGRRNNLGRIWTSTAYIDSNVYRLYGYSDGRIESIVLPVQRPSGTFRVVVVAVNHPNTNIADVLDNLWADAQQEINVRHSNYAQQLGLQAPIVTFENVNLLASVDEIEDTRSRSHVVNFLAGRGISTDDFDIVVMLDLNPSNTAGGFAAYGGDFAYMGYFFQASNSFEVLGLDRLRSIASAVYDHEVGHIWGWEHEWDRGAECSGCFLFITPAALFGWTDTNGDGIPEILSDSPYGR